MSLQLYNTLSREKERFIPLDDKNVRMYVCGPTVYDRAHIGNARSVVVYDVLYRLLCHLYDAKHVSYVRNITDVDDKINATAKARGISIQALTREVTQWFHEDMRALGALDSLHGTNGLMVEPRATEHVPQMIAMIESMLAHGVAYTAQGHVLCAVARVERYGRLSGRVQEELQAGARVQVESYKKDPGDFVLWKPAGAGDDPSSVFDSPWGKGRPGWHIECSAMSIHYLGRDFDIHGGGADLMFPHHENEIAQSCSAHPGSAYARVWVHNGFLTVAGEKMSKSLGNFITVQALLAQGISGEVIRFAFLKTKYREPLDWTDKLVSDSKKELDGLYRRIVLPDAVRPVWSAFMEALCDDMNTPKAISLMQKASGEELRRMGTLLGVLAHEPRQWFQAESTGTESIEQRIAMRQEAKLNKQWAEADRIRNELKDQGIILEDRPDGSTEWRRV